MSNSQVSNLNLNKSVFAIDPLCGLVLLWLAHYSLIDKSA